MTRLKIVVLPLLLATAVFAAECKPDNFSSFDRLKEVVQRVITTGPDTGWDDKAIERAGDRTAFAIVEVIPDDEMMKPEITRRVLGTLQEAFSCAKVCIEGCSDREPRVTLLLLEHLRAHGDEALRPEIDKTRAYVLSQTSGSK